MKVGHILTETEIDDLGSMNEPMRRLLGKVKAKDDEALQAKRDQEIKLKQAKRQKLAKLKAEGGPELKDYIQKLKSHDWYHDYSDDHRVWQKGNAEKHEIRNMQKEIDPDFEIWNEYAPKGYEIKQMGETTTAGSVASSMGSGNGFVDGGPGTLSRAGTTQSNKKKKKKSSKR